jgi:hypothetical protein
MSRGTRTVVENHIKFVKEQVFIQEKLALEFDEDDYRKGLHLKTATNFVDLARFLEEIQKRESKTVAFFHRADTPQRRILLTYEEIQSAPDELLKELNISDAERQELLIEYLIAEAGGVLSLDRIIIGLYARTKEVPKRGTLTTRLFRMANKGMIYNVPGKKGVYSTYELTEAEAKKMFGQFDGESADGCGSGGSAQAVSQRD